MEELRDYFKLCKKYWMSRGDREGVATSKAFWWDMVELYTVTNTWTPVKAQFAMEFRGYVPGNPIPDAKMVEKGAV